MRNGLSATRSTTSSQRGVRAPSIISTRSPIRSDVSPSPALAPLNALLSHLLIPIQLSSLALATPSLLLTLFEALLETRFEAIQDDVRGSWERKDRTTVADFLIKAVGEVLVEGGDKALDHARVEVKEIVRGREEAIEGLLEGILRIARKMGLQIDATEDGQDETTPTSGPFLHTSHSKTADGSSWTPDSSPTPIETRPATRPPPRSSSSLSNISIRSFLSSPPPLPVPSPPRTPRSTLRLMGLAGQLPPPPPPPPLKRPKVKAKSFQDPFLESPRKSSATSRSEGSVSRVALETPPTSMEEDEAPAATISRVWKGKAREVEVAVCQCEEVSCVEGGLCTCLEGKEEDGEDTVRDARHTSPALSRPSRPKAKPRPGLSHQRSRSHSIVAPTPSETSIPRSSLARPRPRPTHHRSHSTPVENPLIQKRVIRSGYLPLIGDSEVESFEVSQHHPTRAKKKSPEVKLEPPEGWSWIPVSKKDGRPIEAPLEESSSTTDTEEESPYTSMLLKQRERLIGKLRELKLDNTCLEENSVRTETRRDEGKKNVHVRGVIRRRVERVSLHSGRG